MKLILFDFDGTLIKGDSLLRFLLFAVSPGKIVIGSFQVLIKFLALVLSGSWTNERAKETLLAVFFKGQSQAELEALGTEFYKQRITTGMLRPEMLTKLREYRDSGDTVALVSASADIWLRPLCTAENILMICTKLDFENGKFSGKLASPNCNGPEKARRIQAAFDLPTFEKIIAYGNSSGDDAMLALANEGWMILNGAVFKVS